MLWQVEVPRYPGLPEGAPGDAGWVALSHSERDTAACPLRWWYRYGAGWEPDRPAPALAFGAAAHLCLEDLWRWWADRDAAFPAWGWERCPWCGGGGTARAGLPEEDCARCEGSGRGALGRVREQHTLAAEESAALFSEDEPARNGDVARDEERLARCLEGYLRVYGGDPPLLSRVMAVELDLAAPVPCEPARPGAAPYRPEVLVAPDGEGGLRFARPGDLDLLSYRWPWYAVGRLDALLQDRRTGVLWVVEHKTSVSPRSYLDGIGCDPQTQGYLWLLRQCRPDRRAAGVQWDVLSSAYQYDPEPLKRGGYSLARSRTVPSWRFLNALSAAGENVEPYREHLAWLREHYDAGLYLREQVGPDEVALAAHAHELRAVAGRHAAMRRAVASTVGVAAHFPRQPVCRIPGGGCAYRGPCAAGLHLDPHACRSGPPEGYRERASARFVPVDTAPASGDAAAPF